MIVGERKPVEEIKEMVGRSGKVLVVGCGTCVSVCMAGGEKEVAILASQLRMIFKKSEEREIEVEEATVQRQCDREYMEPLAAGIEKADVVLSMACGAGVQMLSAMYDSKPIYPALDTLFIGVTQEEGVWAERCRACGSCILATTGGICPVTICPKGLMNGPCGGTNAGKCEVNKEKECAWTLIYRRLEKTGRLDRMKDIIPARRFSAQTTPAVRTHDAYGRVKDGEAKL